MPWIVAGGILAAKAGQAYFSGRSKKKKAEEQKKAATAQLTVGQQQREDVRRGRLELGASMLSRVPKTTAGGGVNTNVALDPDLVAKLGVERKYDFASTVPDQAAGNGSEFVSGLFGGAGDALAGAYGHGLGGGGGSPTPSSMLYNRGSGPQLPGGMGPQYAPLYPVDRTGAMGSEPIGSDGHAPTTVDIGELLRQYGIGGD